MPQSEKYDGPNRLLAALSRRDFDRLQPHLVEVDLPVVKSLERPNRRITAAYFPEDGIASVVANGKGGSGVEVGLIGAKASRAAPSFWALIAPPTTRSCRFPQTVSA